MGCVVLGSGIVVLVMGVTGGGIVMLEVFVVMDMTGVAGVVIVALATGVVLGVTTVTLVVSRCLDEMSERVSERMRKMLFMRILFYYCRIKYQRDLRLCSNNGL